MPREHLEELLHRLQQELSDPRELDADTSERLRDLHDRIENVLGEDDVDPDAHDLGDRLDEAVEAFGEEHPSLTMSIRRVIQALRSLGFS